MALHDDTVAIEISRMAWATASGAAADAEPQMSMRAWIERAIERAANRERDDYPGIDPATASTADCIRAEIEEIREVLLEKNAAYGDSALSPIRIMSRADPVEQLRVRIDDKLSRLARGSAAGEDVILDLLGYLVLLRIAMRRAKP